jgi:hypothetical protein
MILIQCKCGQGKMAFLHLKESDFSDGLEMPCCAEAKPAKAEKASKQEIAEAVKAAKPVEVAEPVEVAKVEVEQKVEAVDPTTSKKAKKESK